MADQHSNQIAVNLPASRIFEFSEGRLLSIADLVVSEFRRMIFNNQSISLLPNFHPNPVIQMTPNPGD
jgi:hypothetical protein